MVLRILEATARAFFPTQYVVHISIAVVTILVLRAVSQGRNTNRERDLHARTVLVTGGFTPLGLTLLQDLAQRGAHIIALSEEPVDAPDVTILISLLRTTTSNEKIFAEQCNLTSPTSVRAFCMQFLAGEVTRLDAIVFAHEYRHVGVLKFLRPLRRYDEEEDKKRREAGTLATFLMTTLLLPALLVAPAERDIRIVNVVNPFYAAAANPSTPTLSNPKKQALFLAEGTRSLRQIIFTRHLQRILDALPSAPAPKTEDGSSTVPIVPSQAQKSNIVAVSVSPGIGRVDTIGPMLGEDRRYRAGIIIYILLRPFLQILVKSPRATVQSVLHVLFLPTPFKVLAQAAFKNADLNSPNNEKDAQAKRSLELTALEMPEEVLKPGALYSDCAVVKLAVPAPKDEAGVPKASSNNKGKKKADPQAPIDLPDDGEYGGERAGRLVWEALEEALKEWEASEPAKGDSLGDTKDNRPKDSPVAL